MGTSISPYVIDRAGRNGPITLHSGQAVPEYESAGIGLSDCWKIVKAKWRFIVVFVLAGLILTTIILLLMTPQYRAVATLMISPESPHLMDITTLRQQILSPSEDDYSKTQYAILQSDQLIAQVIVKLKLADNPLFGKTTKPPGYISRARTYLNDALFGVRRELPGRLGVSQHVIDAYRSRLKIANVSGTRLADVSFQTPDAALSAMIVNLHVREYLTLSSSLQAQSSDAAKQFLEHELVQLRAKVEKSEAALNAYRSRMGILSFGVHDRAKNEIAEQTMMQLNKEMSDAEARRIAAEAEMQLVKSGDYKSLPEVVNNQMIDQLQPQVDHLQAEYAELSAKYTNAYPPVNQLKARLDEAQKRLNADVSVIARAVERNYKAALSREQQLQQKITEDKQRDFAMNDASLQDAVLAREVDTNRDIYRDVLRRMQDISVDAAAPLPNIAISQDAVAPPFPTSPQKIADLAISGMVLLFVALGVVFVSEQLDDRFKNAEEIEKYLHLPELAVVPDFSGLLSDQGGIQRFLSARRFEQEIGSVLSAIGDGKHNGKGRNPRVISGARPEDVMESFRSIRTALLYSRAGGPPRSVLFISAAPGEGKTISSCGTAWAFAQTGARTLLIDADLREPRCHQILNAHRSLGLSEVLVGLAEPEHVIQRLSHQGLRNQEDLYFLSAGAEVPDPGELLTSMRMFQVLQQLRSEYQFVLVDSAPIGLASDTIGLATMVDTVVVVAGAATSKQTVRAVCRKVSDAGATIAGVVANWADITRIRGDIGRYYSKSAYSSTSSSVNQDNIDT
jgi:succinoglycan biosynthesis transport protein ExoP